MPASTMYPAGSEPIRAPLSMNSTAQVPNLIGFEEPDMHDGRQIFYSSPFFVQAVRQLESVADRIPVERGIIERIKIPKRSVIVTVPVRMDSGEMKTFLGIRVQHSLTSGPGKGGLRFHPDVDLGEVAALAMLMSWKCALAGLPYGGAKGGVNCDPGKLSMGENERITRRFTQEVLTFIGPNEDVMAPDLGTNEQNMAWIYDTYSMMRGANTPQVVTGKSPALYGTVGRREATGRGVVYTIESAAKEIGLKIAGSKVIVQGFGNVGSVAALEMHERGARIVGVGDVSGHYLRMEGYNVPELVAHVAKFGNLSTYPGIAQEKVSKSEFFAANCDILIPAAMERQITGEDAPRVKCKILAEGANGPCTSDADEFFRNHRDQIFVIPDFLCNSGGVIVSYFEWVQDIQMFFWNPDEVDNRLRQKIGQAFMGCLSYSKAHKVDMRTAALIVGVSRVATEKAVRGLFP